LALCLVSVLGGATSLVKIVRFAAGFDPQVTRLLGLPVTVPAATTLGRLVARASVLRAYLAHYNGSRPHQARWQRPPDLKTLPTREVGDLTDLQTVRRRPVVTGMISEYHHAA
jgi:hypothetical protein